MAKTKIKFADLWSVTEVAAITGLSKETVRRRARQGLVPSKTLGDQYRFTIHQIEQFLVDHPALTDRRSPRAACPGGRLGTTLRGVKA